MTHNQSIIKLVLCLAITYLPLLSIAQCPDPSASDPTGFSCDATAVTIQEKIPTTGTGVLTSGWTQFNSEGGSADTNDYRAAFNGGNDACGLPMHSNAADIAPFVQARLGVSDSITNPFPTGNKENAQQDGWLMIPIHYDCIDFRLGGVDKGEASALYAGTGCGNMTLVGENNTLLTGSTNDFSYTLPAGLTIVSSPSCDYFLIRIRLYHNDQGNDESNSEVEWDVGEGFEIIPTGYLLPVSAHDADDLIPAAITERNGASLAGLYDEYEKLWQVPADCNTAPTSQINIPYICFSVEENSSVICNPCQIEMQEVGCICDNTSNTFSGTSPQSVSVFQQTLLVTSVVDAAYTIGNVVGLVAGPTLVSNTNPDVVEYTYTVHPNVAYSFSLTGMTSGVTVVHAGACALPDDCNCPSKAEICGDNLDNDMDGLVDAADPDIAGNCSLDCGAISRQVQGKVPVTDGQALLQIWSQACGNFCCTGAANTQQSPVGIAPTVGGGASNGTRPLIIPFTTTMGTGTGYTPSMLPQHRSGAAGCVQQAITLGIEEKAIADKLSRGRGDQVQMDAWIVLPPSISCIDVRVNAPQAHDGAALFLGPSINDMDFIGASWGLQGSYTHDKTVDGSQTQTSSNFNYDAAADGVALTTPDPTCPTCGFYVVRARWYASDVSAFLDGVVQWNYGKGWENIPATNLQSVGTTAADANSDNNKPNSLKDGLPFCVYQDSDGDLFTQSGQPFNFNKRYCESIQDIDCFTCPKQLTACVDDCVEALISPSAIIADTFPICFLEVFNITPKTIADAGSLRTQFWDGNDGKGFNQQITNAGIDVAFDKFTNDKTCPNCLPQHTNTPTGIYESATLGVNDAALASEDTDGDDFMPHVANFNGGENVQQDGWLLIPSNVTCIDFKLGGGGAYDASRLYLGTELDSMRLIGENINAKGENDFSTFTYEIPDSTSIIDESCDNLLLPLRAVRLRFYHHDNGVRSNTIVRWNVGRGFVDIPATHLRTVTSDCDQTLPTAPTYTDGIVTKVVRDERGRFFLYDDFPATQPLNGAYEAEAIEIDRFDTKDCYTLDPVCGITEEAITDPKGLCSTCRKPYPSISDPCICLDNGGVGIGQFAETVMITGPSNQTWTIKSVTGLTQAPAGVFPPAKGVVHPHHPFTTGATGIKLTETKQASGVSFYTLNGLHIDNIGYAITLTDGTTDLSISNKCSGCEKISALPNSAYIESCGETFADDGGNDGNYTDTVGQKIYTFCPTNPAKQSVRLAFTSFEIASGDTLRVYTGNHIYSNNYLEIRGDAVSKMKFIQGVGAAIPQGGAGWVDATCNNLSGCLTLRWAPNGDNIKGKGWTVVPECTSQTPTMENCAIDDFTVTCKVGKLKIGKIKAPTVTLKNICTTDTVYYLEYDIDHQNMIRDSASIDSLCLDTVALGTHALNVRLKFQGLDGIRGTADDSVCVTRTCIFTVRSTNLPVCNDSLLIPLGSACTVNIRPDDLLEKPDTVGNDYKINIEFSNPPLAPPFGMEGNRQAGNSIENATNSTKEIPFPLKGRARDGLGNGILNNETDSVILTKAGVYNYTVTDACGQSCRGKITLFDNSPPIFSAASKDTIIACAVALSETGLGLTKPKVFDNCDTQLTAKYVEAIYLKEGGVCDTNIVQVTWQATDESGNQAELTQQIVIIRPDLTRLIRLPDVRLSCGEGSPEAVNDLAKTGVLGLQIGRLNGGQFTVSDTLHLNETDYICGYILSKEDVQVTGSTCGGKTFRYWSIADWCGDSEPMRMDTQNIFLADTLAPIFVINAASTPKEIVLAPFACTYDAQELTKPVATDNCSTNPNVAIQQISRIKDGQKTVIDTADWAALTCDTFEIIWVATDDCIEQTKTSILTDTIIISDKTPPTVKMLNEIQLTLIGDATIVQARDIDDGSFDACGIAKYEIRIKDAGGEWDSVAIISCDYLSTDLQLELKVTDTKGNEDTGWLTVNAEDKIDPICALADYEITCDAYHRAQLGASTDANNNNQLDNGEYVDLTDSLLIFYNREFGDPICQDNQQEDSECANLTIEQQYALLEGTCGNITIKRRARAIDKSGNKSFWAIQSIDISSKADWQIALPADWEGTCGETAPIPEILIKAGTCDVIATEVSERRFSIPGDACLKIERTYQIINWCQYEADGEAVVIERIADENQFATAQVITATEALASAGKLTYIQILKVHDEEAPVVTIAAPDACITAIEFDAEPFGEEDETPLMSPFECDEIKTWRASAVDCSDDEVFNWLGKLYDAEGNELLRVDSNVLSYAVYDKDAYRVEFWAFDGCGNSANQQSELITFRDCKKPLPYLKNGITLELSETGTIQVWANDLDQNSFDNCTDQEDLITRIWHSTLGAAPDSLNEVLDLPSNITFTCAELGTQAVHIYVIDEAGNWDVAITNIQVQDNQRLCSLSPVDNVVSGRIINAKGENIEGVTVHLTGGNNQLMTTQADGNYQFTLPTNIAFSVQPEKLINPLNGVSTFDLVLISQHILGVKPFTSPYQYIAADVNKSGSITSFDLVQLRQLILNVREAFPQNNSWRFVTKDYEFYTENPAKETFPEIMEVPENTHQVTVDFIGVKIGDVNGTANANRLVKAEDRQTGKVFNIHLQNRKVSRGEVVDIEFTPTELSTILGYQMTLNFSDLTYLGLTEGLLKKEHFNTQLATKGQLALSWNGTKQGRPTLFSLQFKAETDGWLSDLLTINSAITTAEAYTKAGEMSKIDLQFSKLMQQPFKLYQNTPNPFKETTTIAFDLPKTMSIQLQIMDVNGRVLQTIEGTYPQGHHELDWQAKTLNARGVFYYQLTAGEFVGVEKMVVLE